MKRLINRWTILLLVVAAVAPLVLTNPSHQNFLILAMMLGQLGVTWNILGGYAGQVSC